MFAHVFEPEVKAAMEGRILPALQGPVFLDNNVLPRLKSQHLPLSGQQCEKVCTFLLNDGLQRRVRLPPRPLFVHVAHVQGKEPVAAHQRRIGFLLRSFILAALFAPVPPILDKPLKPPEESSVEEDRVGLLHFGAVLDHFRPVHLQPKETFKHHAVAEKLRQSFELALLCGPFRINPRQKAAAEGRDERCGVALEVVARDVSTDGVEFALL